MINLKNLNIILTGATGVIGNSILNKLVSSGSNVIASGTNEIKLKKIQEKYRNVNTLKFDISDHAGIETFVDNCNKILSNKIDILINNAGITLDNLSIRMKEEEWKKVIDINLSSTFLITKNVIKKMLKSKKGKIIPELEKNEKIDKNLLRYLTVKVKKFDLETDYFKKIKY